MLKRLDIYLERSIRGLEEPLQCHQRNRGERGNPTFEIEARRPGLTEQQVSDLGEAAHLEVGGRAIDWERTLGTTDPDGAEAGAKRAMDVGVG